MACILAAHSFSPSLQERAEVTEVSYADMIRPVSKLNLLQWVVSRVIPSTTSIRAPIPYKKTFQNFSLSTFLQELFSRWYQAHVFLSCPHYDIPIVFSHGFTHKKQELLKFWHRLQRIAPEEDTSMLINWAVGSSMWQGAWYKQWGPWSLNPTGVFWSFPDDSTLTTHPMCMREGCMIAL